MNEPAPPPADPGAPEADRVRPIPVRLSPKADEPAPVPADSTTPAGPPGKSPPAAGTPAQNPPSAAPAPSGQGRPPARPQRDRDRRPPPPKADPPPPPAAEPVTVRFLAAGTEWLASSQGQGSSGRGKGSAPLVLLTFAHADRPAEPVREILCIGRDAARFSEDELAALFERAKPFERNPTRQPIFPDAKGGKKDF